MSSTLSLYLTTMRQGTMKKVLQLGFPIGLIALSTASFNANADIRFNGFASIVAGQTLSDNESYLGYDNDLSFKNESIFALQAMSDLGDGLSATAQIVAQGNENFDTKFSWAYISYEASDYTTVRAGRLRIPFYLYSDYLDVGYAYPWVRPAGAMYSLPFNNYDGVSVVHNKLIGEWDFSFNFMFGELSDTFFKTTSPTDGSLNNMYGLATSFSREWFSGYFTYISGEINIPVAGIESFASLAQALGASQSAADELRIDGDTGTFIGAGFNIDYENWSIIAEYSESNTDDSILQEADKGGYISFGYRVNEKTMPFVMFESFETPANSSIAAAMPGTVIPALGTAYDGIPVNIATQAIIDATNRDEYTATSVGVRYNFHPSAAFKVQYTTLDDDYNDAWDADSIAFAVDVVF